MFKVNNKDTRTTLCSKLTIKTPERRQWRRSGVFIVNFEHISHLVLVFLLLTLNMQLPAGYGLNNQVNFSLRMRDSLTKNIYFVTKSKIYLSI